jgi:flagellar biosynthetic protein FliR
MNGFDVPIERVQVLLFLLTRCSGIFIFTPILGNVSAPMPVRIILSCSLSYLLTLTSPLPKLPLPLDLPMLLFGLAGELMIGLVIGFAAQIVFAGLQYSGQLIGFQIGLSFVNAVDPGTSNRSTTLAIYQNFLGMMLFLGFNGHHWFIEAIARSIAVLPPFGVHLNGSFLLGISELAGKIFIIGFQVAAPVVAILLLTDLGLGLIGRTAPQIHILVIGFPLKVLVGLSGLGLILYFLPTAFRGFSSSLYRDINQLIQAMSR